jgi:YD repeat-containing protein
MKEHLTIIALFLSTVITSCKVSTSDPLSTESAACGNGLVSRITRVETNTSNGREYRYDNFFDYQFDSEQRITAIKHTATSTSERPSLVLNYSLKYDEPGFLISKTCEIEDYKAIGDTYNIRDEFYEYEDGRLVKTTGRIKSYSQYGPSTSYEISDTYDYNGQGRLIRRADIFDRVHHYEYDASGSLTGYRYTDRGEESAYTYTFLDGRMATRSYTSFSGTIYLNKYTYDTEGQLTRDEQFTNEKPDSVHEYFFDDKKLPVTFESWVVSGSSPITFKGHPALPPLSGVQRHNHISTSFDNLSRKYISQERNIRYDGKGFPVEINYKANINSSGTPSSTGTTLLEYCQ